jgi:hypothetical protein
MAESANPHPEDTPHGDPNGSIPPRPVAPHVRVSDIPSELRRRKQWVGWRYEPAKDRWTKVPYRATDPRYNASTTDPKTWGEFPAALTASERPTANIDGPGYVFSETDPYAGLDLDGCRDPATGTIDPVALAIVAAVATYWEVSISGTGLHAIGQATLPGPGFNQPITWSDGRQGKIELYDRRRFFTVSGHHLDGTPETVEPVQATFDDLYAHYAPQRNAPASSNGQTSAPSYPWTPSPPMEDATILDIARAAKNGLKFRSLYDIGERDGYGSPSQADMALMDLLAFYSQSPDQLDRLFQASALHRVDKDRPDYRDRTITAALAALRETYQPSRNGNGHAAGTVSTVSTVGLSIFPNPDEPPAWTPRCHLTDDERAEAARGTFVDDYVAYGQLRTDAPACFHRSTAFAVLSTIVGRRAVLHLSVGDVYPALWLLILAESTIYRKSTVFDLARELIRAVDPAYLAPNDITPQRFIAMLAEYDGRPLLFMRDEVSGFFDAMNRYDFMAGFKELLCHVYDSRPFRRERMKPKTAKGQEAEDADWRYDVKEPFLNFAGATTPERFYEVARVEDLHSGYLPRHLLVVPPKDHRSGGVVEERSAVLDRAQGVLVTRLRALAQDPITLTMDEQAYKRFNRYQRAVEDEAQDAPHPSLALIVGSRCTWMALRAAMLLAVADGTQRLSLPHLLRGIDEGETWRQTALDIFGRLAPSKFERLATRVVDLVVRKGTVNRRDVMQILRLSKRDMDDLEGTLDQRGDIHVEVKPRPNGGIPSTIYHDPKAPPANGSKPSSSPQEKKGLHNSANSANSGRNGMVS